MCPSVSFHLSSLHRLITSYAKTPNCKPVFRAQSLGYVEHNIVEEQAKRPDHRKRHWILGLIYCLGMKSPYQSISPRHASVLS